MEKAKIESIKYNFQDNIFKETELYLKYYPDGHAPFLFNGEVPLCLLNKVIYLEVQDNEKEIIQTIYAEIRTFCSKRKLTLEARSSKKN